MTMEASISGCSISYPVVETQRNTNGRRPGREWLTEHRVAQKTKKTCMYVNKNTHYSMVYIIDL
jgi:hypothetical protein